ncbi:ubiquitin carboxyl-terminal hydrolase isozyme L3-like [Mastomys coucha]|uniref:ubiquitin carboxyl-terminal hydrolase isozyme L3-like n=1 Tax=Mastomys coucha TaxID=35658 RepID=UPI0012621ACE|nr:ubiquitin carboxyl-terminal hydrolase isozyme L3-like [Mastomys coucha]
MVTLTLLKQESHWRSNRYSTSVLEAGCLSCYSFTVKDCSSWPVGHKQSLSGDSYFRLLSVLAGQDVTPSVYFMKQTISNACGTIGLMCTIANNKVKMHFESGSTLKKFLEESVSMSPEERAKYLEIYDAIQVTHETSAHERQTEAPSVDEKVDLHCIVLVHVDGHLYELDGQKLFPINHGKTSDETLLEDAIEVCKKFMERDPNELRFNAIALSGTIES